MLFHPKITDSVLTGHEGTSHASLQILAENKRAFPFISTHQVVCVVTSALEDTMGKIQISFGTLPSMLRQWQDRDRVPSVSSTTASTSTPDQQAQASAPETVGSTANFAHNVPPAAGSEPAARSDQQQPQPGFFAAREQMAGEAGPGPSSLSQQDSLCR